MEIPDLISEDDRVVVRDRWTGTGAAREKKFEFSGIVIWRIAGGQLGGALGVSHAAAAGNNVIKASREAQGRRRIRAWQ